MELEGEKRVLWFEYEGHEVKTYLELKILVGDI
jgi:hypothetical protein